MFFLFFAFHINIFAQANEETELSLEDAVKYALEYNLGLKKTQIDVDTSRYAEKNLWSEIFPAISASASYGYSNNLFSESKPDQNTNSYSVGFSLRLGLNAGIPLAMRNIKLAHQSNILKYEEACNLLSIQVTKKYYSIIAENNNIILLEEILNLAQKQYERSQVSFRNGLSGELAVTQSRLAYENARYNHSIAVISCINSMAEFLAMLGMDQDTRLKLTDNINIVKIDANAEALIGQYLPGRPDIARGKQEIESLLNTEKQTVLQRRAPSLDLSTSWRSANFNPFTDNFSASAALSIPLDSWIPGTSASQNIRRVNDAVQKAKLDLEMTESSAKTNIRTLASMLQNSWDSILIARLGFEAAERRYQLTEAAFNVGAVESLALEDARNNMANARQRLLQSELDYFRMILDLSAAINVDWNYLIQTYGVTGE